MPVTVHIPPVWRNDTEQRKQVSLDAAHVGDLLATLRRSFPALADRLGEGRVRGALKIYVNREDIRYLDGDQTVLQDGDEVILAPTTAPSRAAAPAPPAPASQEPVTLSAAELQRYSRQLVLPDFGIEGQRRLKESSVLCIGVGGLGSPLAMYLAAAGIGRLGLVDFDVVDATNLHRQLLHGTGDVGRSKLESARDALHRVNPHVQVDLFETRLAADHALDLIAPFDVVADGSDNFPTRYLVNDACVLLAKPNAYGSVLRFDGQASWFHAPHGPCYRCLYPEPPPADLLPNCAEGGVLGVLPGLIGMIQATETIKWLTGLGTSLLGRLLVVDALSMRFQEFALQKDPNCPLCGERPTIMNLRDLLASCASSLSAASVAEVTPRALKQELDAGSRPLLLDVREPYEWDICRLPGAVLIPLGQLPNRLDEVDRAAEIVVYCRSGGRSAQGAKLLQREGFTRVRNLAGGTLAWAEQVDPAMPRY